MIYQAVVALAIVAATTSIGTNLYTSNVSAQKALFEDFKLKFKRNYKSVEEENLKFQVFVGNLKLVDERNEAELNNGGEACHGISKFADITQEEFENTYLSEKAASGRRNENIMTDDDFPVDLTEEKMLGATKDWSTNGFLVRAVQDQGSCGAGYAFAASSQIFSDVALKYGSSDLTSPEQAVECQPGGCNGGSTEDTYDYYIGAGMCVEQTYPYWSYDGDVEACRIANCTIVSTLSSQTTITNVELTVAKYVLSKGPLSGCVNSNTWNTYTSGSITLCGKVPNQCIQIVGVNNVSTSDGFWKLKNSWGMDWGMDGYIKLRYGANVCNITHNPTWTTISSGITSIKV